MNAAAFTRLADALGLDANAIVAEMESDAVTEVIAANHALAQRLRIGGTPTFVMGETMLRGYLPQDRMQAIANEIRAR
jgi:2-hydroxychromene-2-carboxylate isomerase